MDADEVMAAISAEVKRIGADSKSSLSSMRNDLDALQTALRRSRAGVGAGFDQKDAPPTEEQKAFGAYLRKGLEGRRRR